MRSMVLRVHDNMNREVSIFLVDISDEFALDMLAIGAQHSYVRMSMNE